jgi:hypothetical protein
MKLDREARRAKVAAALEALRPAYAEAVKTDTEAAWEAVELQAATVHRQARLLAGKSRGG